MTALSTFVKTWSFIGETGTAVITVRLRTETTNAVESTRTSDSREPFAAAWFDGRLEARRDGLVVGDLAPLDALRARGSRA